MSGIGIGGIEPRGGVPCVSVDLAHWMPGGTSILVDEIHGGPISVDVTKRIFLQGTSYSGSLSVDVAQRTSFDDSRGMDVFSLRRCRSVDWVFSVLPLSSDCCDWCVVTKELGSKKY